MKPAAMLLTGLLAAGALGGCQWLGRIQATAGERICAPPGTISVYQLAGRLDLDVVRSSAQMAALRNRANLLVLFADPDGQAFVNGKPVGPAGGFVPVAGMIFVPRNLPDMLRPALRRYGETRSPERRRAGTGGLGSVVIDPGHGGHDPGAISPGGLEEKTVNLVVARKVASLLERRGVSVTLTRDRDVFIPLNDRPAVANRIKADLFVSIHANSAPSRSASGFEIYVSPSPSRASQAAALAVRQRMAAAGVEDRGIKRNDFRVLVRSSRPAMLVELGFLSNYREERLLAQTGYRNRLAEAVADGIVNYLTGN